jgi:DNA-binding NarL/FixJ family response regulator
VNAARTPRVLLVDDHALLADAVAAALRFEGLEAHIADLSSREALIASVEADPPDLILLDLELGGTIGDGAALVRPFVRAGARVLVVSASRRRTQVGTAIEQGAVGHLTKSESLHELIETVVAAARGEDVLDPALRQAVLQDLWAMREQESEALEPFKRLTTREQQVLRELGNGKVVSTIAEQWVVSEATVRSQVRAVLTKLGVSSQLEAVALALRVGWLVDARRRREA